MNGKSIIVKAALSIIVLSSAAAQGQRQEMRKGGPEAANCVKVIEIQKEPIFGQFKFDLQEELSIGTKGQNEYSFNLVSDVKSDDQGNIYVADTKNRRVQEFNRNGMYLKTLGKSVVVFQQPTKIRISRISGSIFIKAFVLDVEIFDGKNSYKAGIHLKKNAIREFEPIDDSRVVAVIGLEYREENPRVTQALARLDSKGEIRLLSREYFLYALEKVGEGWTANNTAFDPELYLSRIDEKSYVYGYSKAYELNVIDQEGKVLYRIKRNGPKPVFTAEESIAFRNWGFPDSKPYFFGLFTDSKGRIYVQRNITKGILNAVQEKTGREVDIFSKDGQMLYTSILPPNTCEIRDGLLYAYAVNEVNGLETVKRYRIKNWEDMK
jgi:hypothetical protein